MRPLFGSTAVHRQRRPGALVVDDRQACFLAYQAGRARIDPDRVSNA